MRRRREDENGAQEVVELAALADGSLAPERRVGARGTSGCVLGAHRRLAEQQRAVTLMRSAAEEVEAPAALRARIEAQRRRTPREVTPSSAPDRSRHDRRAGRRRGGAERARFGHLPGELPRCPCIDRLSPGATGDATLTKTSSGWRIELDATGLPRLENGRFYEAWLRNTAGVLVPIGTFNEGRKGHALGRGTAERLHDPDRHARAGRRRSVLVGREGARRTVDTGD